MVAMPFVLALGLTMVVAGGSNVLAAVAGVATVSKDYQQWGDTNLNLIHHHFVVTCFEKTSYECNDSATERSYSSIITKGRFDFIFCWLSGCFSDCTF